MASLCGWSGRERLHHQEPLPVGADVPKSRINQASGAQICSSKKYLGFSGFERERLLQFPLIAAEFARPRRIHVIHGRRSDRFYPTNFPVFNQEHFRNKDAGGPVEARKFVGAAIRKSSFVYSALVKDGVGPNNTALPVHQRKAAAMNVLDYKIDSQLKLRQAIH